LPGVAQPQPTQKLLTPEMEPTGSHTLAGPVAKRAEIAGRIEALQIELRELIIALENLDATIQAV
jgi:hypothetical protein